MRKGEILGFYVLVGAGRSELLKAVMGLYPKDSGKVYLKGEEDLQNVHAQNSGRGGWLLFRRTENWKA